MGRTGQQRLDAIPGTMERAEEFKQRVITADGDAVRLADLMAEAIWMLREANGSKTREKWRRGLGAAAKVAVPTRCHRH